jgi:hypothetical protein
MATPYAAVSGGTKDSYNFYHSQLRIRIECTFGMPTHKWAVLRSAIPMNITIQKTVELDMALANLHNYCINAYNRTSDLTSTANDEWITELNGAVPLVEPGDSDQDVIPQQLLAGGNHFDDVGGYARRYDMQRRYNYMSETDGVLLPSDRLHSYISSIGFTRQTPLCR